MENKLFTNIELMATPNKGSHAVNKDYVDDKSKTITWADYQALSEDEKNNGTTYYIPDMPLSSGGTIIGDVEYGNFFSTDLDGSALSDGCTIDFHQKTRGNLTYENGVKLTKGKMYLIYCNVVYARSDVNNSHIRFDIRINGQQIWVTNGIGIASESTSLWSDGALVTHYKCDNDGELLTVNCVSFENVNQIIGGLSTLVITEIPSIQAAVEVTDEHIKEVASGGIADVARTAITLQNVSSGDASYYVKNGIAYVSVMALLPTSSGATYIAAANSVPKPNANGDNHFYVSSSVGTSGLLVVIPDGSIISYCPTTNPVFGMFSYPVAES